MNLGTIDCVKRFEHFIACHKLNSVFTKEGNVVFSLRDW